MNSDITYSTRYCNKNKNIYLASSKWQAITEKLLTKIIILTELWASIFVTFKPNLFFVPNSVLVCILDALFFICILITTLFRNYNKIFRNSFFKSKRQLVK